MDQNSSPTRERDGQPELLLWTAIQTVAEERGIKIAPFSRVVRSSNFERYRKDAAELSFWVTKELRPESKTEHRSAVRACARALLTYMGVAGIPMSPTTLMAQVANIPYAVDRAWPGYVASGTMRMVYAP